MATVRYLEARDQALQNLFAGLCRLGEGAEGVARPVISVEAFGAVIGPVGIVADAGHADEQVHVPHHLGEDERWDLFSGDGPCGKPLSARYGGVPASACVGVVLPGVDTVEADLVCCQIEVGPRLSGVGPVVVADAFDPELGP